MRKKKQKEASSPPINPHAFDEAVLTWAAPEYPYHEKSARWFIAAGSVVALLVFYGLATDGWTFSVAMLVAAGTYYLLHRRAPERVAIKLSRVGVKIGAHNFPYNSIKYFWILYDPPVKRLYLRMAGRFRPDVFVELGAVDPVQLHRLLGKYVAELKGMQEPFSDTLVRLLKL